jgi:methylated-DNA-[protein]-cysteine S-methyltransferase
MTDVERVLVEAGRDAFESESKDAALRVAGEAESLGLVDVAYTTVESPVGQLLVAATPRGLVRVAFEHDRPDAVIEELSRLISSRALRAPQRLDEVRRELDQYFEGKRRRFDFPLDWMLSRGFTRKVLRATARVPYGKVATYRDVAGRAGNLRAVRAAGNAVGANPIPIVVPCHRIIRSNGGLGGYGGGLDRKKFLLDLEAPAAKKGSTYR